jgi:cytoskeleton protein RodZ
VTDQPTPDHAPPQDPAARAAADERSAGRDAPTLGRHLREARERSGLGLSDLAEVTHVRRVYLTALEEGRYRDLPEDVYARNFVRLYANAVGLDPAPLLDQYVRERQSALGRSTLETRLDRDRQAATQLRSGRTEPAPSRRPPALPAWLLGPWLPTVALVAVVVALAVWGYNGLFTAGTGAATPAAADTDARTSPAAAPPVTTPSPGASLAEPVAGTPEAAAPSQVLVSIVTDPPGAAVTIDGFPVPGVTPLLDIPVTARDARVVRAELDGYAPSEVRADLRQDADLALTLEPVGGPDATTASGAVGGEGELVITITDTTWLEVYRSTARNEGERLVYTTAQPGATYRFSPPVFVYTGNAAGVRLDLSGQDLGPMGSPGAVLGRAFPE